MKNPPLARVEIMATTTCAGRSRQRHTPFLPPMASRAFLAMLSVQLETLAVDYSNASKTFDGPGIRRRRGADGP